MDEKSYFLHLISLIVYLITTAVVYLIYPVTMRICKKKPKRRWVAVTTIVVNCIVFHIIFAILGADVTKIYPPVFWGIVGYCILMKQKNKSLFLKFLNHIRVDVTVMSYKDVVKEYGKDGVEEFTGLDMQRGDEVFWFVGDEPMFYVVKKHDDLTKEDIENMLTYLSVDYDNKYDGDIFDAFTEYAGKGVDFFEKDNEK